MTNATIIDNILRLSISTAALTIPAISVAYLIMSHNEDQEERMQKVIGNGTLSALIFLGCFMIAFPAQVFGFDDNQIVVWVLFIGFTIAWALLVYIIVILAGFRREPITLHKSKVEQTSSPASAEPSTS